MHGWMSKTEPGFWATLYMKTACLLSSEPRAWMIRPHCSETCTAQSWTHSRIHERCL